jgi:hypothetical protein
VDEDPEYAHEWNFGMLPGMTAAAKDTTLGSTKSQVPCKFEYMHLWVYVCMYLRDCCCQRQNAWQSLSVCVGVCTYVCVGAITYASTYICAYMHACTDTPTHTRTHTHTHTHQMDVFRGLEMANRTQS